MDDEEEEYPNKETKEFFEGVEKGDEEVVKVLLLGKENKQFELDINFKFKEKKVFFQTQFSLSFSLSLFFFCCLMKKLSKFFFLETKTNNSNLISTSSSKKRRFFFQTHYISLSLSLSLFLSLSFLLF